MKKEYLNPTMSLLIYVEESILTTSAVNAGKARTADISQDTSVKVKMSDIISLD